MECIVEDHVVYLPNKDLSLNERAAYLSQLVHGQVTIIFVVSVCLFVHSFSQPSLIRFRSN